MKSEGRCRRQLLTIGYNTTERMQAAAVLLEVEKSGEKAVVALESQIDWRILTRIERGAGVQC